MAEDNRSVIIHIPKPRVCVKKSEELLKVLTLPTIIKKSTNIGYRKPSESEIRKYCSHDSKPAMVGNIGREEILLPYKMYAKRQKKLRGKHLLEINLTEKYKIRQTDFRRRLYVEDPPNDISTIVDIDKDFFNYVNGRALKRSNAVFKSFKTATADVLRLKVEVGYRNDAILNVDINHGNELETYELSVKRCMKQAKYFEAFISEDYLKSMNFLRKCEDLKTKLQLQVTDLQNLGIEQFTIISRLMGLDFQFHLQQKYGRFLYYLSPPSWRAKNRDFAHSVEIEAKGFDLGYSNEDESFLVVFEELQKQSLNPVHPVIYFNQAGGLIDIFIGIEKHLYHHLDYVCHLIPQRKIRKEQISRLKQIVTNETALVFDMIKGYEKILLYENERCDLLKQKFFSILNGLFYQSVAAPEVLKLYVHLEFCYEKVYVERPINMDIISMAKSLEKLYMDYCYKLDYLHSDNVKVAITKALDKERQKMKRAKFANRELWLFNRLERHLRRAHEPIPDRSNFKPFIQPRSRPHKSRKHGLLKNANKAKADRSLTENELEYLTLFTDWTEGENPDAYLHRTGEDGQGEQ